MRWFDRETAKMRFQKSPKRNDREDGRIRVSKRMAGMNNRTQWVERAYERKHKTRATGRNKADGAMAEKLKERDVKF